MPSGMPGGMDGGPGMPSGPSPSPMAYIWQWMMVYQVK
jgi:hypothetical protein